MFSFRSWKNKQAVTARGAWPANRIAPGWLGGKLRVVNATPTTSPPFSELVRAAFHSFSLR